LLRHESEQVEMDDATFRLFLFSTDTKMIADALAGGVSGIIVDWENDGKIERQTGADTQINHDTVEDLKRVRSCTGAWLICRVNPNRDGEKCAGEIEAAIDGGADEIMLPMVRSVAEVEAALKCADGRCAVGILIETSDAVMLAEQLGRLPLSRVYVGLNDLAIERGTRNIFESLADGTVDYVRDRVAVPFGFAGLTLPDRGHPIPCRLLISEMARLSSDFSFLRRSFYRDMRGRDMAVEVPRILEAIRQARLRSPQAVARDRRDLERAIRAWSDDNSHMHMQEFGTLAHRGG
jgi:hypothetical protein